MILTSALLLLSTAEASECPNPMEQMTAINTALEDAMMDELPGLIDQAKESLLCQTEVVSPLTSVSLYQLIGAVHVFLGDEQGARDAFRWSAAVSPTTALDQVYGDQAMALFSEVREEILNNPPGSFTVQGGGKRAWLDGREIELNAELEVTPGPHLLQWGEEGALEAQVMEVAPSEIRTLPIGGAPPPSSAPSPSGASAVGSASFSQIPMISGGASLAVGVGLLLAARSAHQNFYSTESVDELSDLAARTNMLSATGLGLTGLGLAGIGLGFALPASAQTSSLSIHFRY